jgi:hypothetical protein
MSRPSLLTLDDRMSSGIVNGPMGTLSGVVYNTDSQYQGLMLSVCSCVRYPIEVSELE